MIRLLSADELVFHEFEDEDNIPPYSILSHTWEANQEVSYQEMIQKTPETMMKSGFKKIENTALQAQKQDIEWIWIDTCCIDKSSSAELTEAINCMASF